MGWTGGDGGRAKVTQEQKGPFKTVSGNTVTAAKHHRHGVEDWFLYEVRNAAGELVEKAIHVTVWDGGLHKEMSIECHPYYYGCPVAWLDEVPAGDGDSEHDWRMQVRGTPVKRCDECRKLDCPGHMHELIVTSASGSWATNVPDGMVGVVCSYGGRSAGRDYRDRKEEYRLVAKEAYDKRYENNAHYFVVPEDAPVWEYDEANPHKPSERKVA